MEINGRIFSHIHQIDRGTIGMMYTDYSPVFVLTTGRSGSKFLASLLGCSPNVMAYHEPMPALQYFSDFAFRHRKDQKVLDKIIDASRMELVLDVYIKNKIYAEANQCLVFFAPAIRDLFKKSKFVHLVRHPGDFAVSAARKGWYIKDSLWEAGRIRMTDKDVWAGMCQLEKICWAWQQINRFIEDFKSQTDPGRILTVKAEDLFERGETVRSLLDFIGAETIHPATVKKAQKIKINEFHPRTDDPPNMERNVHFPEYGKWDDEMKDTLGKYTSRLAETYGYALHGKPASCGSSHPMISVVVPNYNNERYIRQCLDSILGQTYRNFEIVVGDDCSTDNSPAIIREYLEKYPDKVKGLFLDKNRGTSFNRNHAIRHAKGEYLATLDSDDYYYDARKLEEEMKLALHYKEKEGMDIIAFSDIVLVAADDTFMRRPCPPEKIAQGMILEQMLARSCMIPRDFLLVRKAYTDCGGYDPAFRTHQDWDLKLRVAAKYECYFTGIDGIAYRRHAEGASSLPFEERSNNLWRVFEKNIGLVSDESKRRKIRTQFSGFMEDRQRNFERNRSGMGKGPGGFGANHSIESREEKAALRSPLAVRKSVQRANPAVEKWIERNRKLRQIAQERLELIHRLDSELKKRQEIIDVLQEAARERLDVIRRLDAELEKERSIG